MNVVLLTRDTRPTSVVTAHSLEPLPPWKAEQLGRRGYALSCFGERTGVEGPAAATAVSDRRAQLVLRAGAPDTPELGAEVAERVRALARERGGVVWVEAMLPRPFTSEAAPHRTLEVYRRALGGRA